MGRSRPIKPERVALFGGTFDPVHLGHTEIARAARNSLQLDLVVFIPCRQSPHKDAPTVATQEQRLAMLALALAAESWATISDIELRLPQPSFSWLTAEALSQTYPDSNLYWLMGADQWDTIEQWERPSHLSELVEFIVHARDKEPADKNGFSAHHITGQHPASASEIRKQPHARSSEEWLHPDVARYLKEESIYS